MWNCVRSLWKLWCIKPNYWTSINVFNQMCRNVLPKFGIFSAFSMFTRKMHSKCIWCTEFTSILDVYTFHHTLYMLYTVETLWREREKSRLISRIDSSTNRTNIVENPFRLYDEWTESILERNWYHFHDHVFPISSLNVHLFVTFRFSWALHWSVTMVI